MGSIVHHILDDMDITVKSYNPREISQELYSTLSHLHLTYGQMWPKFCAIREDYQRSRKARVYVATSTSGTVHGWLLRFRSLDAIGDRYHLYTYVRRESRGQGVGTALVKASKKHFKQPTIVYAWNEISTYFYDSFDHDKLQLSVCRS